MSIFVPSGSGHNVVRWVFGGGAFIITPTSDTNTQGIPTPPTVEYAKRILSPSWSARERREFEGGGNIDWRNEHGDSLTWWGATGRYWHQWLDVLSVPKTPAALVTRQEGFASIETGLYRTNVRAPFNRGGLWHKGRSVQYGGSDLIDTNTPLYGACLTQLGGQWYLHYITYDPMDTPQGDGAHELWRVRFDRDTSTASGELTLVTTMDVVNDLNTIFRPFLFNGSGTQAHAVRRQYPEGGGSDPAKLWTVTISAAESSFNVGDFASQRTTTQTRTGHADDEGFNFTESLISAATHIIGVDWVGDTRIDITETTTHTITASSAGAAVEILHPFGYGLGSSPREETIQTDVTWTGPNAGSVVTRDFFRSRLTENAYFVYDAQVTPSYSYWRNYGISLPEEGFSETTDMQQRESIARLHYLDARYGIALYTSDKNRNFTASESLEIEYNSEGNPIDARVVSSGFSYTPHISATLQCYKNTIELDSWLGTPFVFEQGGQFGHGTTPDAITEDSSTVTESNDDPATIKHAQALFQGVIAGHPEHLLLSYAPRWAYDKQTETVVNGLYNRNGRAALSDAELRNIVGIDNDNEGYAPLGLFSAE